MHELSTHSGADIFRGCLPFLAPLKGPVSGGGGSGSAIVAFLRFALLGGDELGTGELASGLCSRVVGALRLRMLDARTVGAVAVDMGMDVKACGSARGLEGSAACLAAERVTLEDMSK